MDKNKNYTEIEGKALWYLQRYASSSNNLRQYLRRKTKDTHLNYGSHEIIEKIIRSFESQNILNDKIFSESKVRSYLNKGWAFKKINNKLLELGISKDVASECISEFANSNDDVELISAIKLAKKRSIGPFRKSELTDKLKMKEYGILSRAGFSYSLCKKVLNELNLEEIDLINNEG